MSVFQIKEYGKIRSVRDSKHTPRNESEIVIDEKAFDSVWSFILEFQSTDESVEKAFKLITKNGHRQIQVQNYVGIIETTNNTVIEILPKIFSPEGDLSVTECKKLLVRLIASLYDVPQIVTRDASLETKEDFPILEVFIKKFIEEVELLALKGIRKDYVSTEQNGNFLKGQLLFSKDILKNLINKSRFYTRYNQYLEDIPQNRLIKSTLSKLYNLSKSPNNKSKLHYLLATFSNINNSHNIRDDLQVVRKNTRLFSTYEKVLIWSELFLLDKGFTSFSGDKINQAILFPMEKLFESFVAKQFKKYAKPYYVNSQHNRYFLVNDHRGKGKFRLKPDLFLQAKDASYPDIIVDTKWKMVNSGKPEANYQITQSDMYQLYAYGKKYSAFGRLPRLVLLYPLNANFQSEIEPFHYEMQEGSPGITLTAVAFNLSGNFEEQILYITQSNVKIA